MTLHQRKGDRVRGPLPRTWVSHRKRQRAVVEDLKAMLARNEADDVLPSSPRNLFYQLRPSGLGHGVTYRKVPSVKRYKEEHGGRTPEQDMVATPDTVQEALLAMRRAGQVDEDWIADLRAPKPINPYVPAQTEDDDPRVNARVAARILDEPDVGRDYPHPLFVEGWCEAEGLGPRIATIADPWDVPVYPSKGFEGYKSKQAAGQRVAERAFETGLPTVAFHIGDGDRPGWDLYRAGAQEIAVWACHYFNSTHPDRPAWEPHDEDDVAPTVTIVDAEGVEWLRIERLTITPAQLAEGLVKVDEEGKAEAEAIPPLDLTRIVVDFIERWLGTVEEHQARIDADEEAREARRAEISTESWRSFREERRADLRDDEDDS